jgi:hypothetical protein
MFSNDHKVSRAFAFRSSFGATIVRYRDLASTSSGADKPVYMGMSSLSHDSFNNRTNWICELGPVFHF